MEPDSSMLALRLDDELYNFSPRKSQRNCEAEKAAGYRSADLFLALNRRMRALQATEPLDA
jgi:hypothetical protein